MKAASMFISGCVFAVLLSGHSVYGQEPTASEILGHATGLSESTTADFVEEFEALASSEKEVLIRALRFDPRIIGGVAVDIEDYRWQVALIRGYAPEPGRSQFCGGTLIAADVVVTAAHCIDNSIVRNAAERVDIVAGSAFYMAGGERRKVASLFVHPEWGPNSFDFDVAILKLEAPVSLGSPVALHANVVAAGTELEVSGWGALSEGGQGSPDLMAATLPAVSDAACKASYGEAITARMLCAGLREGGLDSCQGDSGGPLVLNNQGRPVLVGVVSWGEGCARRERYGVYTRISAVSGWIQSFLQAAPAVAAASVAAGAR